MEETREDRMRSRMRGAARHQVSDADFGTLFTIPALAPATDPAPEPSSGSSDPPTSASKAPTPAQPAAKRTSPNTSAKRRRLEPDSTTRPAAASSPPAAQLPAQPTSANRSSRRQPQPQPTASSDPYDLDNAPSPSQPARPTPRTRASVRQSSQELESSAAPKRATQNDAAAAPPKSSPLPTLPPTDEVSESPANAPGSGHRTRVRDTEARDSSVILQSALRSVDNSDPADGYLQSSSPLSRLSRKSIAGNLTSAKSTRTGLRRSTRLSGSPDGEVHELASDPLAAPVDETIAEEAPTDAAQDEDAPEVAETVIEEEPTVAESPEVEVDEAREIDDREAARRLGRKRSRRSLPAPSPEIEAEDEAAVEEEPVAKRPRREKEAAARKRKRKTSPVRQRQPKAPRAKQAKPKPQSRRKSRKGNQQDDNEDDEDSPAEAPRVGIAVQRFAGNNDSDDEDVLNSFKPHSDRNDVNAIDLLAQLCEEVIGATLKRFKKSSEEAEDAPTRKELKVKVSALRAFQEELRTRLLEHTIALDTLFSLKKRVREAQKEKLKLRDRLVEIRKEREHVALRMDAVRAKHEEDSKQALHNISLSTTMHDIDLAIEQGRAAPELSTKEAKQADLANLELLIGKVAEQACGRVGAGMGTLGQIKGFNAFLERAMAVL